MADEYDCWAGTNQIMSEVQKKLQAMKDQNEALKLQNQELRQEICLLRQDLIDLRNQHALGIITKPGVEMVVKELLPRLGQGFEHFVALVGKKLNAHLHFHAPFFR